MELQWRQSDDTQSHSFTFVPESLHAYLWKVSGDSCFCELQPGWWILTSTCQMGKEFKFQDYVNRKQFSKMIISHKVKSIDMTIALKFM